MKMRLFFLIACTACMLSGCISTRSYVDTKYKKAKTADIAPNSPPKKATVAVKFQRNGEPLPAVAPTIKDQIVKTLTATRVFEPVESDDSETDKLFFEMNNIADLAYARKHTAKAGDTFEGAGILVSDNYAFTGKIIPANGKIFTAEYKHALHTSIDNAEAPPGLTPTTAEDGVIEIIDDLVLNFLNDYQTNISATSKNIEQ